MKPLHLLFAASLLLTACNTTGSVTYELTKNVTDPADASELVRQSLRVIERRLDAMGEEITDKSTVSAGEKTTVTIQSEHQEALDSLTNQLQEPFDLEFMAQTREGETPDLQVEGHGGFKKQGITGADILWVESRQQSGSDKGEVRILFTPEGKEKMAKLFVENKGRFIGLMVRGVLVSKLQVETDEMKDDIVIRDIPSYDLAQIFADDVNVGLHVTFTPVP